MNSFLATCLKRAGVDRAIAYTLLSRGWTVIAGPLNLFFVVSYLSKNEQGFYYTFASVLGLQIFFELGLAWVVLQFVSHERALLQWTPEGTLQPRSDVPSEEGTRAKTRLGSLVRRMVKWYGIVSLGFALIVPASGWGFFAHHPSGNVNWMAPWLFVSLVEAGNLLATPYFAVVEGCGQISQVAVVRLGQNVASSFLFWIVLGLGGGLWGATVAGSVALLWSWSWLWSSKRSLFLDLWRTPSQEGIDVNWKREIWPLQWKIAVSWLSGYFVFSLFNPVAFAYLGATTAGRIGMSITITTALWTMAYSWISTKASPFGALVAERKWPELDALFFPAFWKSTALIVLATLAFWGAAFWVHAIGHRFAARILDPLPLAFLCGATIVNHIVVCLSLYLRSHKEEPFLGLSLTSGCLVGLSTLALGRFFGATGMMVGYFAISCIVGLGMGVPIFNRKRRLWHAVPPSDPSKSDPRISAQVKVPAT